MAILDNYMFRPLLAIFILIGIVTFEYITFPVFTHTHTQRG